ncbi:cyclic nucleotide-binding domain-containing protein [Salinarimonas sp.]|uniref:Crp/Fnr family transcriptional regulator n=1 Tax=Salinarimonas sp. TaxID=2766526 RepID=UPI0032D95F74
MSNPLVRRLAHYAPLTREDERLLDDVSRERTRRVGPREDVSREGDRTRGLNLLLDGWAMRYKSLEDGRRQILSFALPGDLCEQQALLLARADHSLGAITAVTVAEIAPARLAELLRASPRLAQAFA